MTVQEIIEAIKNDNLRSNVPFHFVALDKDKGGVAEYGKSSCLEDEIYMLTLHMGGSENHMCKKRQAAGLW